jgi:hypothetical protein
VVNDILDSVEEYSTSNRHRPPQIPGFVAVEAFRRLARKLHSVRLTTQDLPRAIDDGES